MKIIQIVLGVIGVVGYFYWLYYFFRTIEPIIKERVARYFQVKIITNLRGEWKVISKGNAWRNFGIELLQAFFLIFSIFTPLFLLTVVFFVLSQYM
jgi:hypothetical protein